MAADRTLSVSIVTPRETAFEGKALAVSVPGSHSPFQVLYNHAPIISSLDIGVVIIEDDNNNVSYYAAREGFIEVLKNNVNIVVQELLPATQINAEDAEADLASARESDNGDRARREQARMDIYWAEARMRASRLHHEA
ncbi:MAG: ATP synthase F1 subunit epsilon [Ignavibacteria bacterium]|jgi:F-type H+-transporting ATPase subunit epsilon